VERLLTRLGMSEYYGLEGLTARPRRRTCTRIGGGYFGDNGAGA